MSRAQFTYGTVLNLLLFSLASNASEILDSSEDDGGFIQDPKIRETVSWAHKCADKSFICTYDCNVVTNATGDCVRPNATTCFNLMVDYNYTLWKSPFPHHLAGLQKFPTCWQVLEPLICGIWYRPCAAMRTFNLRRGTPKMSQYFKAYSMDYCYKVRSKCQKFVHLLPPELDCDEFAHPREEKRPDRTLYNPECELKPAFNLTLANSAPQCFHPLSLSTGINGVSPLVDQCYLPCRTDYFGHINAFYHFVVVFCTTIALCAPALPVYLLKDIRNSKLATWNYVFNMCTASICVYYTLWSIFLMLVYFKKTTVCQKDELGNYLRIDFHTIWCKSQRIALQFVLTSIISWSFVLSYCLLIDRNFKKASNSTKGILTMVVYLLSVTLVVISMIWDVYYADPYYGVCHPGMDPFLSGLFLYVPAVVTSIFLLVTYVLGRRSGPVRPESSKPMVGVNLGGIRINLSFPGLATNLMVFVIGAISHFSPSKSTHDEIVMVKRSVSCFTSRSEGLVGLIQEGNSASDCVMDPPVAWQPIWIFVRMHLLPVVPCGVIVVYLFYALKDGILKASPEEEHEMESLNPASDEEAPKMNGINKRPNSMQTIFTTSESERPPRRQRRFRRKRHSPIIRDGIASSSSQMDSDAALPRVPIGYENALLKHTLALLTNGLVPPGAMLLPQAPMNKMNWMPAQMGNENMAPGPSEGPNMRPGPSGFVPRPNGNQRRAERRRNDEEDSNYFDSDNLNSADERDLAEEEERRAQIHQQIPAMEAGPSQVESSTENDSNDGSNDFNSDELNSNDERDLMEEAQRRAQIHKQCAQR